MDEMQIIIEVAQAVVTVGHHIEAKLANVSAAIEANTRALQAIANTFERMHANQKTPSTTKTPAAKPAKVSKEIHAAFKEWWKVYPRATAEKAAKPLYIEAVATIREDQDCDEAQAIAVLLTAAQEFAHSNLGKSRFALGAVRWLAEGHWNDARAVWARPVQKTNRELYDEAELYFLLDEETLERMTAQEKQDWLAQNRSKNKKGNTAKS